MSDKFKELEQLVVAAKDGDSDAMREIIEKYKFFVCKEAGKYSIKGYDYEDLVQHGYLSIIGAVRMFKVGGNFTSYVTMCVCNNFRYLCRGNVKHNREVQEQGEYKNGYEFTLEDQVIAYEELKELYGIIDEMGEEDRFIIEGYYFRGLSMGEIGEKLGMSYAGVTKRKKRVLEWMRERL